MEYKVICCDVDGTLLTDDKKISEQNKYWISKVVREKNVRFVIVSGRTINGVRKFYYELGITGPASCCNGTCLFDENDNLVQQFCMKKEHLPIIVEASRKFNLGLVFIKEKDWYMENRENYTYSHKINFYYKDCIVADFDSLIQKMLPNKMAVMDPDRHVLDRFKQELFINGINPEDLFLYEGSDFVEIMPGGTDKALALDAISNSFKIPIDQIIAIGDDYNDIKMIKKAGLGIAMANAVEEAKDAARFVTLSNNEDGVAFAIKKLFF